MTEAGWTSKKPTAAGWYWYRDMFLDAPEVVHVIPWDSWHRVLFTSGLMYEKRNLTGEWVGPLEVPQ